MTFELRLAGQERAGHMKNILGKRNSVSRKSCEENELDMLGTKKACVARIHWKRGREVGTS